MKAIESSLHAPLWAAPFTGTRCLWLLWSSLVHHPGSNELPASVNVAGRPGRLSITGQLGRDTIGQREMMSPLAAL